MILRKQTIEDFLDVLASDAPAPGGGSVAALNGALGASLVEMVCRLSVGRPELESHGEALSAQVECLTALRAELVRLVDDDTDAFSAVMAAFKMPKGTDAEKATRTVAIQDGYKRAVEVPLQTARYCVAVAVCASEVALGFNANAGSDLGTGIACAVAGFRGASMNVRINLPSIKDAVFVQEKEAELSDLEVALNGYQERVLKAL